MTRTFLVLAFGLLTALPAFPQDTADVDSVLQDETPGADVDAETAPPRKTATAVRITDEIVIDGRLDEPAWASAFPATGFVQRSPFRGRPASEPTEVRFLYDEDNLYIGVICFDSEPDRIVVNDLDYDFSFRGSDNIEIAIDSLLSLRSAFYFRFNPAGAKSDAQISDQSYNYDWDGVWDVRTSINDDGWVAEVVIPFKTLRFSRASTQVWGINMGQKRIRLNEDTFWFDPLLPIRYSLLRTSLFGTLEGLDNMSQGQNLKITPFVTAGVTQVRSTAEPSGHFTTTQEYDGGLDLKYSLTPSLTLDATYRTDFAHVEVDQQQVNLTRFGLFFPEKRDFFLENAGTFSFGAGNNLVPFFSRRIGLSRDGTPIPIIGGTRVTGQVGRYDVGVLAMRTEREGSIPSNDYVVGRVKRNLFSSSWIGALATSRDSSVSGDYNRVYGADAYFQFYERLSFDSHILKSETPGRAGNDLAKQLEVAWREEELIVAAGYNEIQRHFNPELGFVRRGNNTRYNGVFSWNPRIERSGVFRNLVFGTSVEYYESEETKQIETRTQRADLGIDFENNGSIRFAVTDTFDRLVDPFRIRRGIEIARGDYRYLGYSARASSNPGRRISGNANVDWGEFWDGDRMSFRGGLNVRPNAHLSIGLDYRRDHVDLPAGRFTTDLIGTRLMYAFSPRAFLNGFFQYNSSTRQVSSNIRLNIIHRPLSDIFVVYNDVRDASGRSLQRALVLKFTNLFDF